MREAVARLVEEADGIILELLAQPSVSTRLLKTAEELRDGLKRWLKAIDEGDDA